MLVTARRLALPLGSLLVACGPSPGDMTATLGSTTADPPSTSSSTTTGTTGAPTTGDSTDPSTSTSSTGTSTSTTGTTSTTGPASVCDPQPEAVTSYFTIDGVEYPAELIDLTEHCTVDSVTQSDPLAIVLSGCKVDPDDPIEEPVMHTIDLTVSPDAPLDLVVGEQVVFSFFVDGPFWYNHHFTLRRPTDELVLAGLRVSEMPGEQWGAPPDFFAPLSLSIQQACEPEPIEPPHGSGFIMMDPCVQIRRELLRFEWQDGAVLELIDRSTALWPDQPYRIVVGAAEHLIDLGSCSDTPSRQVRALILRHQP